MPIMNRIANLFRRSSVDGEIAAELESHIALRIEDNIAAGMTPEEARRDALVRFGNRTATRENVTAADSALSLDRFWFDLRYAMRQLIKSPGFAITAIVTLAVAIAANAIVFSVLNALVLRPLNLPGADRLVAIQNSGEPFNSYPDYRDLLARNKAFDGIALYNIETAGLDTGGNPQKAWIYEASSNYFDVLGVQPFLGRFFHSSDDRGKDSIPSIVLSYAYWRTHFHSDENVVGRTVALNRHQFTILGVAPPEFRGAELMYQADFWVPAVDQAQIEGFYTLDDRGQQSALLVGRLKPGVSVAQATADLDAVGAYLKKTYPINDDGIKFSLVRPGLMGNMLGGPVRAFVAGLMLLAGLILLAACANLGSLFAARAADRSREIALRMALGSTRRRILRQLLTEALLVATAGGAAGIAASVFLLHALSAWQPLPALPRQRSSQSRCPHLRGGRLAGNRQRTALRPVADTPGAARRTVGSGENRNGHRGPIDSVSRFATSFSSFKSQSAQCSSLHRLSLCAASLARLAPASASSRKTPCYSPRTSTWLDTAATASRPCSAACSMPPIPFRQLPPSDSSTTFLSALVGAKPSSSKPEPLISANRMPLPAPWNTASRPVISKPLEPRFLQGATLHGVTTKTPRQSSSSIANSPASFSALSPMRSALTFLHDHGHDNFLVIGVVEDGKYITLTEDPKPAFFRPLLQSPSTETTLVTRTSADPNAVAPALHDAVRALDSSIPFTLLTWDKEQASALFAARAATVALGVLGLLGAMLAITGIFGMASYSVSKRLKEMGIRIALGAGKAQVLGAALGRAFRLLAFGSVAGILLGLAATRVLAFIVYQASPSDPVVLAGTILAMMALGLAATWAPAHRALLADPSRLMREE